MGNVDEAGCSGLESVVIHSLAVVLSPSLSPGVVVAVSNGGNLLVPGILSWSISILLVFPIEKNAGRVAAVSGEKQDRRSGSLLNGRDGAGARKNG